MSYILLFYGLLAGFQIVVICITKREEDQISLFWMVILSFVILSVGSFTLGVSERVHDAPDLVYLLLILGPLLPMFLNILLKLPDKGGGSDLGSIRFVSAISLLMVVLLAFTFAIQRGLL